MVEHTVDWLQLFYSAVAFVVAVAGLFAALGVIARSRFGGTLRWVIHRLIVDPVSDRMNATITLSIGTELEMRLKPIIISLNTVEHEVKMNNGSSMRDEVSNIRTTLMTFIGNSTLDRAELHGMLLTLLEHDAERDAFGRRYGRTAEAHLIGEVAPIEGPVDGT